jgi:hypothetical protein
MRSNAEVILSFKFFIDFFFFKEPTLLLMTNMNILNKSVTGLMELCVLHSIKKTTIKLQ